MPPTPPFQSTEVPLCVDLDGTLIKTDLLWESLVRLLAQNPLHALQIPFWWMHGRARLKAEAAARVNLDPANLPYNQPLLQFLREEKRKGRPILLVTASDIALARQLADYLRLFDHVLASDGATNLRGATKGAALAQRFGERGFDYAGNSSVDLPVWQRAREAIVVNNNSRLAESARKIATVGKVFEEPGARFLSFLHALRPHQWVKNLIVFVPLFTSHKLGDAQLRLNATLAAIVFSLCASALYLLNDLLDLDHDRHHPSKAVRPFASGQLPIPVGLAACPLLLAAGATLAWETSHSLAIVLAIYVLLTTTYSWRLKQVALLDVFFLAGLYTIRLIAGHEATGIKYSNWLLVFSMFIFLSLALVKRFQELAAARDSGKDVIQGRGYAPADVELVATLGTSSGYLAVLVLALYVNSQEVRVLYERPVLLLLVCPLLLYWISRVWMLAHRGRMHEDPIVFALKDPASYIVGALCLGVVWAATGKPLGP